MTTDLRDTVRRTLVALSVAFAFGWTATSMSAGPGSAAFVALSGNANMAGMYVALAYIGSALGAAAGGRAMDAWGRRPVLIAGYLVGAVGYAIAGVAVATGSLAAFVAGTLVFAAAFGVANLTRVGAAELFPPAERGRGMGVVQTSAIAGAIVGPVLLVLTQPLSELVGRPPLTLVWFLAPPLLLIAAVTLRRAGEPMDIARELAGPPDVPAPVAGSAITVNRRLFLAAIISLSASQAAMASVMGIAGAAVVGMGHGVHVLGTLMLLHFFGMFGLSRVVGQIADRFGRKRTILAGLAVLASGGLVVALVPGMIGFGAGLMLVGFGWSFGFIGSSVLLTDIIQPQRRARVLGRADLTAQLTAAAVSTAGGFWFAANGVVGLGIMAVALVAIPFVVLMFLPDQ